MAKFCQTCGSPCQEGELFCSKCGTRLPQMENGTRQPVTRTTTQTTTASTPIGGGQSIASYAALFKRYLIIILAVVAVFSLIVAILNVFGTYDVKATISYGDYKESNSGPISDLYEADEFTSLQIVNIIYGIVSLGLAGLAALLFLKLNRGDADTKKLFDLFTLIGLVGTVLYMILFWITGSDEMYGASYRISLHFTAWIALIIHAALFAADKLLLKDDNGTLR